MLTADSAPSSEAAAVAKRRVRYGRDEHAVRAYVLPTAPLLYGSPFPPFSGFSNQNLFLLTSLLQQRIILFSFDKGTYFSLDFIGGKTFGS